MNTRRNLAVAFAVATVILGIGGGIAATHALGSPAPQGPAVQDPQQGPAVDLPEPGDTPDVSGG